MAANCFKYEERIWYGNKPNTYHGWYMSWGESECKVAHLKSRELCDQMVKEMEEFLSIPSGQGDQTVAELVDVEMITACHLAMSLGNDDNFAFDLVHEKLPACITEDELWDEMRSIGDKYATNYENCP